MKKISKQLIVRNDEKKDKEHIYNIEKKIKKDVTLYIFTDGACPNNGKIGAYAGYGIHFPEGELNDVGNPFFIYPITNQRAELYAIYHALLMIENIINEYDIIKIYTDSQYSINCLTNWIHAWIKNNWRNSKGKRVENKKLIKNIHKIMNNYNDKVRFVHVSAHTKGTDYESIGNRRADKLAVYGASKTFNPIFF